MVTERSAITTEAFEAFLQRPENHDRRFELIHGELVEKVPTFEHGMIALAIGSALRAYLKVHGLGWASVEARYQKPDDPHNSRIPDVSFLSKAGNSIVREGAVPALPDLAVEIQSPNDSVGGMREKAAYYLANGSRLVWLVYPRKQIIEIHSVDKTQHDILTLNDTLTGGDVLPGFSLPVRDIFEA